MRAALLRFGLLTALLLTKPSIAVAETPAENKAAARALALQALQLAQQDKCDEAIPLLERAEALFHAPTILASIGECQIRLGRLVEGTETLHRVVREELTADAPSAFVTAQSKARSLLAETLPKIAKLVIQVEPPEATGLEVTVDGAPIAEALVGAPRPTDPGPHRIEASAPGYETAHSEITLHEGDSETIELRLQPIESGSAAPPRTVDSAPAPKSSARRTVSYVGIGLGGALLAVGGVTGVMALTKENSLAQRCPGGACPASERDTLDSARSLAGVSTMTSIAGAAIGLTGLILLLTDGSSNERPPAATGQLTPLIGPGSLGLSGSF